MVAGVLVVALRGPAQRRPRSPPRSLPSGSGRASATALVPCVPTVPPPSHPSPVRPRSPEGRLPSADPPATMVPMDDTPGSGTAARRAAPKVTGQAHSGPEGHHGEAKATKATKATRPQAARHQATGCRPATEAPLPPTVRAPPSATRRSRRPDRSAPDRAPGARPAPAARAAGAGRSTAAASNRTNEHWALATRGVSGLLRRPELILGVLGHKEPVERDGRILNRASRP